MLEILLIMIALFAMAKKGGKPRRRKFNLRRVRISPNLALTTLAAATVLTGPLTGASDAAYRAVVMKNSWTLSEFTAAEGPVTVGYAHSDYSVTEIKECLEITTAISPGDKVAQEKANRLVRVVGTFPAEANSSLNDGKPISTKLNWFIPIGKAVNIFAFNEDASNALTTGAFVNCAGDMWVKDT